MRLAVVALVALAVLGQGVYAHYGEEEGGYGGGDDEEEGYGGGGGGGGGGDEEPPPEKTQELTSLEDFEAFIDNNDASIIAAFTEKELKDPKAVMPEGWDEEEDGEWDAPTIENPVLTTFNSISSTLYNYRFAFTSSPEVMAKLKCKKNGLFLYRAPKFVSVKDGDRPRERFPSDTLSQSAVSNWIAAKAQPLVGQFSHSTKDRYKNPTLIIFMNLDFDKNAKSVNYVLKRARKVAAHLKTTGAKLSIAVASNADMSYDMSDYGLESKSTASDILMGIRESDDYSSPKYSGAEFFSADSGRSATFSEKSLSTFANAFIAGELTAYEKPPPPPTPPYDEDESPSEDEPLDDDADKEEM